MKKQFYILLNIILFTIYFIPSLILYLNYIKSEKIYNSIIGQYQEIFFEKEKIKIKINNLDVVFNVKGKVNNDVLTPEHLTVYIKNDEVLNTKLSFIPKEGPYLVVGNFDLDSFIEILFINITEDNPYILDFYKSQSTLNWSLNFINKENHLYNYISLKTGFLDGLAGIIEIFFSLIIAFIITLLHIIILIIIILLKKRRIKNGHNETVELYK